MPQSQIPQTVIAVVGDALGIFHYNHTTLDTLFLEHGAPGDPPEGNCVRKCQQWLTHANEDPQVDAFQVLGGVLRTLMESGRSRHRERVNRILAQNGLSYADGGRILGATLRVPSRSLESLIRERDLNALEVEFQRALKDVEVDPPSAVTAACSILESLCKVYIEDNGLDMPRDQSIKDVWKVVQRHLGLNPAEVADQDITRILGGLSSVVDGVGALRTHAGSAHGRGRGASPLPVSRSRLAVHASHTLVTYVLEVWDHEGESH